MQTAGKCTLHRLKTGKVAVSEACSMNVLLVHRYREFSATKWDTMYRRRGTV